MQVIAILYPQDVAQKLFRIALFLYLLKRTLDLSRKKCLCFEKN